MPKRKSTSIPEPEPGQLELPCWPAQVHEARETTPALPLNIVLIDFENTQPQNLNALAGLPFKVNVFTGEHQAKISLDFAAAMQGLGENATYVRMTGRGPNALDFHIAYYLGELAASEPGASFFIVSKDRGFDPLIKHLGCREHQPIQVQRVYDFGSIPAPGSPAHNRMDAFIAAIVKMLVRRGVSKPRKLKTLANSIDAELSKQLKEGELAVILKELQARGIVMVSGVNVSYTLPHASG